MQEPRLIDSSAKAGLDQIATDATDLAPLGCGSCDSMNCDVQPILEWTTIVDLFRFGGPLDIALFIMAVSVDPIQ